MSNLIDLTGKKFTRLKVISRAENSKWNDTRWNCVCDCGTQKTINAGDLKTKRVQSCGCLQKERVAKANTKHGFNKRNKQHELYMVWAKMKTRCLNKNDKNYSNYGGRGIQVCKRWINSFPNFLKDMGDRPKNFTLERIDNEKGYSPSNCIWASHRTQGNNKRNNVLVSYQSEMITIPEIARRLNIPTGTVWTWNKQGKLNDKINKMMQED